MVVLDRIYRIDRIEKSVEPVGACVPHARIRPAPNPPLIRPKKTLSSANKKMVVERLNFGISSAAESWRDDCLFSHDMSA